MPSLALVKPVSMLAVGPAMQDLRVRPELRLPGLVRLSEAQLGTTGLSSQCQPWESMALQGALKLPSGSYWSAVP